MIKGGSTGSLLRVDLSEKRITTEKPDPEVAQRFIGGTGYAAKVLWDELKPETDPLGPENIMMLSTGLLTGSGCPGSDSLFACFKSPLTDCWGEARCGGGMGVALKRAGFDGVIIEGAADSPVYLWIHDGRAEIRPAGHLWGKTVPEVQSILKQEVKEPKSRVICIGPAGEKKVRYANLMVENLRAMGRCGGGAVLGSKNLKAVVIRGTRKVAVADAEKLKSLVREMTKLEKQHPESGLAEGDREAPESTFRAGTASFLPHYDTCGETPTKNAMSNTWGRGGQMYATLKKYIKQSEGCADCILRCGKRAAVDDGKWKTPLGLYPEYETMVSFGHYLLNDNVEAIIHLNHLCNINGVDTISCGNAVAFAMEGYEKGWLSADDVDGLDLTWGNMDAAASLVKIIIQRKGLGDLLAQGVRRAAAVIGKGSSAAAMHVKGLELPAHDTRTEEGGKAWAIQYGTGNRGMCHVHPHEPIIVDACHDKVVQTIADIETVKEPYTEKGKGRLIKWTQDYGNSINTLGLCNFHSYLVPGSDPDRYLQVMEAVSGMRIDFEDLMTVGERVTTLQRCFNVREGIRRSDDRIPERLMQVPSDGPFSERPETAIDDFDAMLDEYYEVRGWDLETGVPEMELLKALDLHISLKDLGVR